VPDPGGESSGFDMAQTAQAAGGGESLRLEGRIARLAPASTDPRLV